MALPPTRNAMNARRLASTILFVVVGCGGAPATPVESVASVRPIAPAVPGKGLAEGVVGDFVSLRFGLKMPLPDGKGWRIDDHAGTWLLAKHGGTASELLVRTWRDDEVMNRGRCEARARGFRKLPERESAETVEKRALDVPSGFDTVVEVSLFAPALAGKKAKTGEDLRGFALAFGGKGKRCFAWVYTTSAGGPGAEAALGERLATMVQTSLAATTAVNELDPQIDRAPAP